MSKEDEVVKLDKAVRAEGSVEIWLMSLLNSAKEALHNIIRSANVVISDSNLDLLDFINKFQAQVSITIECLTGGFSLISRVMV